MKPRSWYRSVLLVLGVSLSLLGSAANAQKETEIYIPIGQSPGVSGILSAVGEIESYDLDSRTLTVRSDDGTHTARLTDETRIWLDRSLLAERNRTGDPTDCQPGRRVEVKYVYNGETRTPEAEWLKIQLRPDR